MNRAGDEQLKRRKAIIIVICVIVVGMIWSVYGLSSTLISAERTPNGSPNVHGQYTSGNSDVTRLEAKGPLKIVIDPGHGGKDPGAEGVSGNYEKEYTLALSQQVADLLQKEPMFEIFMTRKDDTFIKLGERAERANQLKADVFISIHGNTYSNPEISGTESYYYDDQSLPLAQAVHQRLLKATGFKDYFSVHPE